jgi:hypothetical protein
VKVVVVLLALLLAGGLWWLLGGGSTGDRDESADLATEALSPELQYLTRGTEAVTLWVKAPDGSVPPGAEVGLRHKGQTRWLYALDTGRRQFLKAPIGPIEAVARAPGYEEVVKEVTIQAGFADDVTLVLRKLD